MKQINALLRTEARQQYASNADPMGKGQYQTQHYKCLVSTWRCHWVRNIRPEDHDVIHEIQGTGVSPEQYHTGTQSFDNTQ